MSKSKPKKKRPAKSQPPHISYRKLSARASSVLDEAAKAATPTYLKQLYGVEDESLVTLPPDASVDESDAYNIFLYVPMIRFTERGMPSVPIHHMMKRYRSTMASGFSTAAALCLTFMLMRDDWDGADPCDSVFDALTPVEHMIPDEYYDTDMSSQGQKHAHVQFSNGFVSGLADMINWEALTNSENLQDWAHEFMKLTSAIITEDRLNDLNARCPEIYRSAIQWVTHAAKAGVRDAHNMIASSGLSLEPSRRGTRAALSHPVPKQSGAQAFNAPELTPDLLRMASKNNPLSMRTLNDYQTSPRTPLRIDVQGPKRDIPNIPGMPYIIQNDEPDYAPPWLAPMTAVTTMSDTLESSTLAHELQTKFRPEEIFYAAFSLLDKHRANPTCFDTTLAVSSIFFRFVHPAVLQGFDDESTHKDDLVFNTYPRLKIPERIMSGPCIEDLPSAGLSLWNIITSATGVITSPKLRIRMRFEQDLLTAGFTQREAAALCGYIEGLYSARSHTLVGMLYLDDSSGYRAPRYFMRPQGLSQSQSKPEPEPEPSDNAMSAMKAEYESRIARMQAQAGQDLDKAASELRRSRKSANHKLSEAETRIKSLEDENADLLARIKRLESEKARLSDAVIDLTIDQEIPDTPPDDDTDDGKDLPTWPSEAGSDCIIRFYGGNDNTIAELSRRFPNVEFSPPWRIPNTDGIVGADIIIVDTHNMKHKMWFPLKNAITRNNKSYVLCPTRGINACSRIILDAYEEWKAAWEE